MLSDRQSKPMEDNLVEVKSRRDGFTNITHGITNHTYEGRRNAPIKKTQSNKARLKSKKASKSQGKARRNNR